MAKTKKSDQRTDKADDTSHAPESGDPTWCGRSQGYIINKSGAPAGQPKDNNGGDTDYESGRHGTK